MKQTKINLYLPLGLGGPTTWGRQLAEELNKRNNFKVKPINSLSGYLTQPIRSGVCHSTLPFPTKPLLASKNILTIHGNFNLEKGARFNRFYPKAIRNSDIVTVPSKFLKDELNLKSCLIIPNGIHPSETQKLNYKTLKEHPTVGILTNFNFPKKADGVITLANILKKLPYPVKLVIGGEGDLFEDYKAKLNNILPNIIFLGHCKKEVLFSQIDIFTYYSYLDNQPIALLEAMDYALPVLSNNIGATSEMLNGQLSQYLSNTPEEYEEKLKMLLKKQSLREDNALISRKRSTSFHWENILPQWLKIYQS